MKQVFTHFNFFRSVSEISVTTVNNYFHCWQNCKECLEEQTKENFIPGKKNYFNFFKFLSEVSFVISEKLPHWLSKLQSTYLFKVLSESIHFCKLNMSSTFFGFWDEKMGLSVKDFFSGFNQQNFALLEKNFDEKIFPFRKSFLFLLDILEFQWFICLFAKLFTLVCQTTDQRRERKKMGKLTWKICFFNQFWTLRRKNLDFQQNCKAWFSKP